MENEWKIAETDSIPKNLDRFGTANNGVEFEVELTIPEYNEADLTWKGLNAPVRHAGAKTVVTVFIEDHNVGTYTCHDYSLLINATQDTLEGYVLATKLTGASTSIVQEFDREDCAYSPNKTLFMVNIYDENYVSSYSQYVKEFSDLKKDSKFMNVKVNPTSPLMGEKFYVNATLATEFGASLPSKEVFCQYQKDGIWTNITDPKITDVNGSIGFEINIDCLFPSSFSKLK